MLTNTQMTKGRFLRLYHATRKVRWIGEQFAKGNTVYVSTYTKVTKYTAKHADMFKATKTGLYVQHGNHWLNADGCGLSAFPAKQKVTFGH